MGKLNGRKIEAMYANFGAGPAEEECRTCSNLICARYNRAYYKCRIYGNTASEASDWRVSWPACGMYNREMPEGCLPVMDCVRGLRKRPREVKQIEGQTEMEGLA